jgi:hypothetical protein
LKVFVLAAGYGTRGRSDFAINKLAFKINGEPLLSRIMRLLKQNNVSDINVVVRNDKDAQTLENVSLLPKDVKVIWATGDHKNAFIELKATMSFWSGDTLVLLGDLVFSDRAIKYMLGMWKGDLTVFGWGQKEGITPRAHRQFCDHGEVFAVKVRGSSLDRMKDQINKVSLKHYDLWNIVYGLKIGMVQVTECKDLDSARDLEIVPRLFKGL